MAFLKNLFYSGPMENKRNDEMEKLHSAFIDSLRVQLHDAVAVMEKKQEEFMSAKEVVARIEAALASVEALGDLHLLWLYAPPAEGADRQSDFVFRAEPEGRWCSADVKVVPRPAQVPTPAILRPYVAPGGGSRLKSKRMLFDLFKEAVKEPVTRDQLRERFFEHYGRKNLEMYWKRPDNALNTAIDRAVEDHYIEAIPIEGGETLYRGGWADSETGEPAFQYGEDD